MEEVPSDQGRKDGIVIPLDAHGSALSERGTIAFWVHRIAEPGGTRWNTILSLADKTSEPVFEAYLVWDRENPATQKVATSLHITGKVYIQDNAAVFGRQVFFDREVRAAEWVHLAITWGPNGPADNKVYLNGKEAASYQTGETPAERRGNFGAYVARAGAIVVGSSQNAGTTFYRGLIGQIKVHDTVETAFDLSRYKPTIRSFSDDSFKVAGISGKLVAGDRVAFALEAEPGGKAFADVGEIQGVPLPEDPANPGRYAGTLVVPPGRFFESVKAVGRFQDESGAEAAPVAGTNAIAVDSRSRFALSLDKTDLPADSAAKARIKVKVNDANGNAVKGHRIHVSLATTDEYTGLVGGGAARSKDAAAAAKELLAGAGVETRWSGATDSWGEAEFDFVAGFAAKTVIIQAKDMTTGDVGVDYVTSYKEASIDIALTPPVSRAAGRRGVQYIMKIQATRTELTADGRSRSVVRATLLDPAGSPVAGDPVEFTLSSPNGTLRTVAGKTDASGTATAEYVAGKKIGIVVVTANAALRNVSANVSILLLADAPAKIHLAAKPSSLPADGFSRADVSVKVTDINDNPNKDTKVEFRVSRGGGALAYPDRTTDSFGDASTTYTAGTTPGMASVVATVRSKIPTEAELAKARHVLFVPDQPEGEEIRVEKWLKRVGDTALKGEPIVEYSVGRGGPVRTLTAPYDCRIDFQYVEYWDDARTGDTLALISPVAVPGLGGTAPPAPALSPRRR